jgi:glutamate decarboxylase
MRALVKLTLTHSLVEQLANDLDTACKTLAQKGGVHPEERKRVHTSTSY